MNFDAISSNDPMSGKKRLNLIMSTDQNNIGNTLFLRGDRPRDDAGIGAFAKRDNGLWIVCE